MKLYKLLLNFYYFNSSNPLGKSPYNISTKVLKSVNSNFPFLKISL